MKLYVSAGGNLGPVLSRLRAAADAISSALGPVRSSGVYRTAPWGAMTDQPHFLNAVFEVNVGDWGGGQAFDPSVALSELQAIEASLGRDRSREVPGGPRPIDLDLLLCGTLRIESPSLRLPHPRIAERRFVLQPLCDLVGPEFVLPFDGRHLAELLSSPDITAQELEPVS